MRRSLLSLRKSWQFVVGLFVATLCLVGLLAPTTLAQIPQPSLCAARISPPALAGDNYPVYEVIKDLGVARTGPHDDCWRVTPLPRGTRARVVATATGPDRFKKTVPWSQLDYGAWIESSELQPSNGGAELAQLTSATTRISSETTELVFPLSRPVPIEVEQGDRTLSLTLHSTAGQLRSLTDSNKTKTWTAGSWLPLTNPVINSLAWQRLDNDSLRVNFQLKPKQQWGYQMSYQGNNLVLSLRQPPKLAYAFSQPLRGVRLVIDPGHGGQDSGAVGRFNGVTYMEKTLNIQLSQFLEQELQQRGAVVTMTRTTDVNPSLDDRQVVINQVAPALSVSIHHDASATGRVGAEGASIYWYHPQSRNAAAFLLDYFARNGNRPILNNNGVLRRSFAVARPSGAPAVLLEVGFMTSEREVTALAQTATQQRLAKVLADGITQWVVNQTTS
jgi:N-acetylmuramoyl-L-alanine amidase